ncbi:hypothetical protein FRB99_004825 [Tulasnella sp. 403]|nr:hypothetical protein FRB99_004825 [Tulasnella sp. 403]
MLKATYHYFSAPKSPGSYLQKRPPIDPGTKRSITTTARFVLAIIILITLTLYQLRYPLDLMALPRTAAFGSLSGWHSRIQPFEEEFKPTRDTLAFVQLRNSKVEPAGFTAAFFAPNIVVDARGVVSTLSEGDWHGLKELSLRAVTELPNTGHFRNQWRIKQDRTGYPIDWLRVATASEGGLEHVSVYGYDGAHHQLEDPVGDYTSLPSLLKDTFGLMQEARDGYERGHADEEVINKVKAVLGD